MDMWLATKRFATPLVFSGKPKNRTDVATLLRGFVDDLRGTSGCSDSRESIVARWRGIAQRELSQPDGCKKWEICQLVWYLNVLGEGQENLSKVILDCMASHEIHTKTTGYSAFNDSIHLNQDFLFLATNQIRKDMSSADMLTAALALHSTAALNAEIICENVHDIIIKQAGSSRPYIRKKAIFALMRVVEQGGPHQESAMSAMANLLQNDDAGVVDSVCAAVLYLLRYPRLVDALTANLPVMFNVLNNTTNNWVRIRLLKVLVKMAVFDDRVESVVRSYLPPFFECPFLSFRVECLLTAAKVIKPSCSVYNEAKKQVEALFVDPDDNLSRMALKAVEIMAKREKEIGIEPKFTEETLSKLDEIARSGDVITSARALEVVALGSWGEESIQTCARLVDAAVDLFFQNQFLVHRVVGLISSQGLQNDPRCVDLYLRVVLSSKFLVEHHEANRGAIRILGGLLAKVRGVSLAASLMVSLANHVELNTCDENILLGIIRFIDVHLVSTLRMVQIGGGQSDVKFVIWLRKQLPETRCAILRVQICLVLSRLSRREVEGTSPPRLISDAVITLLNIDAALSYSECPDVERVKHNDVERKIMLKSALKAAAPGVPMFGQGFAAVTSKKEMVGIDKAPWAATLPIQPDDVPLGSRGRRMSGRVEAPKSARDVEIEM